MLQASGLPTYVYPVDGPDQLWATDITYMPSIKDGNCYCFNVVDVFTRVQDTPRNQQNRDKSVPVYHTKRQKGDRQLQEAMILMDTRIIADRLTAEKDIRIHQYATNTQKKGHENSKGCSHAQVVYARMPRQETSWNPLIF